MLKSLLRDEYNQFLVVQDLSAISDLLQNKDRLLWLDLDRPSPVEFRMIQDEFNLHPLAIEDAMAAHPRPKVDQYENFYLVVFYLVSTAGDLANSLASSNAAGAGADGHDGANGSTGATGRIPSGALAHNVLRPGSHGAAEYSTLPGAINGSGSTSVGGSGGVDNGGAVHTPGSATSVQSAVPRSASSTTALKPFQTPPQLRQAAQATASLRASPLASDAIDSIPANPISDSIVLRELIMFMGENYLITVHDDELPELAEVARRWRQNVGVIKPDDTPVEHEPVLPGCRRLDEAEKSSLDAHLGRFAGAPGGASATTLPQARAQGAPGSMNGDGAGNDGAAPSAPLHLSGGASSNEPRSENGQGKRKHAGEIGILLYSMLDTVVDNYFPVLDNIVDRVENLEEQIFEKYNQAAVEQIFSLKKDLLALRKVLAPERDVLNVLVRRDLPLFDEQTLLYFQDLYDHVIRITDSVDTYRDLLSSALDSFLSMQSNRLNITVQTLTSVSIMLMSIAAVTGWYGMNFVNMPELHTAYGYPVIIGVVALIVIVEYFFFKRKRWL